MNLLPASVIQIQRRRSLWKRLAAAETMILLILAAAVGGVNLYARHLNIQVASLESRLQDDVLVEADRLANAARAAETALTEQRALLETIPPARFSYAWLPVIQDTLPADAAVTHIDIQESRIILTMEAPALDLAEPHRTALADTGLFTQARYGTAARLDTGGVRYTLILETD